MPGLMRRLTRLERQSGAAGVQEVFVRGGFSDDGLDHATAGGRIWQRQQNEAEGAFRDRVRTAARAMGQRIIIYGGLLE